MNSPIPTNDQCPSTGGTDPVTEQQADRPLDGTACSALLDLFAGWAILQILKNRSDTVFSSRESSVTSDRYVIMGMPGMGSTSSAPDALIGTLIRQHYPTLDAEMTQVSLDAPLRSPWNRPHSGSESLYSEPLVARFLELVGTAIRRHNDASGVPQQIESPERELLGQEGQCQ